MRTGIIEWAEIDGVGTLTLAWDDGERERAEWSEPITSRTDSHEIASQFGAFDAVSHDGRFIHVSRDQAAQPHPPRAGLTVGAGVFRRRWGRRNRPDGAEEGQMTAMERITPGQMKSQGLVKIGDWGYGTPSTSGEIVCRREDRDAVRAAYDAIPEGDLGPNVLDDVIAAGGRHVVIAW